MTSKKLHKFPIISLIFKYKRYIFILTFFNFLSYCFMVVAPLLTREYIDTIFVKKSYFLFSVFAAVGGGIFLLSNVFNLYSGKVRQQIHRKLTIVLSRNFLVSLFKRDILSLQTLANGEKLFRFDQRNALIQVLVYDTPELLSSFLRVVIVFSLLTSVAPFFSLMIILASPLFLARSWYVRAKIRPLYNAIWQSGVALNKKVQEMFSRIWLIKSFGLETRSARSGIKLLRKNLDDSFQKFCFIQKSTFAMSFLSKIVIGAVSFYGGWLIMKDKMTLGSYTAAMMYLNQLVGLIESSAARAEGLIQHIVPVEKFCEILKPPCFLQNTHSSRTADLTSALTVSGVSFSYNQAKIVLDSISFSIPEKSWVSIAGASGCGKTTLAYLLVGLYKTQSGAISFNSVNVNDIDCDYLRKRSALCFQEPFLFDSSVRETLLFTAPHVAEQKIEEVLRLVDCFEFMKELPRGLDTSLGENGFMLSQGYKQRLALARALIEESDILILDEATSSIDSQSEATILANIRQHRKGKTTIIISHRLSAIRDAECIYFLEAPNRICSGRHQELLQSNAAYKQLFASQL